MTDESGAIAALTHVGIDVSDLERAEAFYSALLGVERYAAWDQFIAFTPLPNGMIVYLQQVPEKKTAKTRVHFDLTAPDVMAAVPKVQALGARLLNEEYGEPTDGLAVFADLDGNEFCLLNFDLESKASKD